MPECSHLSTYVLHKQLAIAIDAARAKKADVALMRKRQQSLLLQISSLVAEIRSTPATTIEDFLALLDVALEDELDLACEMAFYGPADYPIITRLLRVLLREAPGFEFNSLRRWLSVPDQFEQLMGRPTHLETAENDGVPDEPEETAQSLMTSKHRAARRVPREYQAR